MPRRGLWRLADDAGRSIELYGVDDGDEELQISIDAPGVAQSFKLSLDDFMDMYSTGLTYVNGPGGGA